MKKLLLATLLISAPAMANWMHVEKIDLMTDKDTSHIGALALAGDGLVAVRCAANGYEIVMSFDYLGDKYTDVMLRFDSDEPFTVAASPSTSGKGRFIVHRDRPIVIEQMKAGKRMVARARSYRGNYETFAIDLTGFSDAVGKLGCVK
jgi:hypothetical protein